MVLHSIGGAEGYRIITPERRSHVFVAHSFFIVIVTCARTASTLVPRYGKAGLLLVMIGLLVQLSTKEKKKEFGSGFSFGAKNDI